MVINLSIELTLFCCKGCGSIRHTCIYSGKCDRMAGDSNKLKGDIMKKAVVLIGGKQYLVEEQETLRVDLLPEGNERARNWCFTCN